VRCLLQTFGALPMPALHGEEGPSVEHTTEELDRALRSLPQAFAGTPTRQEDVRLVPGSTTR